MVSFCMLIPIVRQFFCTKETQQNNNLIGNCSLVTAYMFIIGNMVMLDSQTKSFYLMSTYFVCKMCLLLTTININMYCLTKTNLNNLLELCYVSQVLI